MYDILSDWVIVNYPIEDSEKVTSKEEKEYSVYDFFISFIKKIIEL